MQDNQASTRNQVRTKTGELEGSALNWAVGIAFNPSPEWGEWKPATNWAQGGPIIEQERIEVRESKGRWIAMWWADNSGMAKNPAQRFEFNYMTKGPTPLVAAMRAYVASKLGDEIDVPDELV
jgi:hypothetical protein